MMRIVFYLCITVVIVACTGIRDKCKYASEYHLRRGFLNGEVYMGAGQLYSEKRSLLDNKLYYRNFYLMDKSIDFDIDTFADNDISCRYFSFLEKFDKVRIIRKDDILKKGCILDGDVANDILTLYLYSRWEYSYLKHGYDGAFVRHKEFYRSAPHVYSVGMVALNDNVDTYVIFVNAASDSYLIEKSLLLLNFKSNIIKSVVEVARLNEFDNDYDFTNTSLDLNGCLITEHDGYSEHIMTTFENYKSFLEAMKKAPIKYIETAKYRIDDDGYVRFLDIMDEKLYNAIQQD